jgi:hypothetical protein
MSPVGFVRGVRGMRGGSWSCGVVVIVSGVSDREECQRIGGMSPVAFVGVVRGVRSVRGARGVKDVRGEKA